MVVSITDNVQNTSSYCWDYLVKNPTAVKQKVAIVYAGRSGSMMLSGLLDGHSHLLSFNCYCDSRLYLTLKDFVTSTQTLTIQAFKKFLNDKLNYILEAFYEHPVLPLEVRKQYTLNLTAYFEVIDALCENVREEQLNLDLLLNLMFIAYGKAMGRPLHTTQPIMVIQIHTPFFLDNWKYLFNNLENLNLIVMVRNPLKALDSHFYHHTYEVISPPWYSFYERILVEFNKSFLPFCESNMQDRSYCMFFEDLHKHPEKTMRAFCKHLHLPFEEILLEETLEGQKTIFVSTGKVVSGASHERAKNTDLRMMRQSDVAHIEYLYQELISDLGYELKSTAWQRFISRFMPTHLEFLFTKKSLIDCFSPELKSATENSSPKRRIFSRIIRTKGQILKVLIKLFLGHYQVSKMQLKRAKARYKINKIQSEH